MLDIPDEQIIELKNILHKHLPASAIVYAFGSRRSGTNQQYSDLDLLIINSTPIAWGTLAETEEALSDSDLLFRVDLLDSQRLAPDFLNKIMTEAVVL